MTPAGRIVLLAAYLFLSSSASALTPPPQNHVLESGTAAYAAPQDAPSLRLGSAFTLECWVYRDSPTEHATLLGRAKWDNPDADYALLVGGSQVFFAMSSGTPGSNASTHPVDLPLNHWSHVAGVYQSGTIQFYLNGVKVDERTGAPMPSSAPQGPFEVASLRLGQGGIAMRQARVWGRALTLDEITSSAGKLLTGREAGLVADWPLDDGSGQSARDAGPSHLALQLGSTTTPDVSDPLWARAVILDTGPYYVLDTTHLSDIPTSCAPLPCGMANAVVIDFNHDNLPDVLALTADGQFNPTPVVALRNDGGGHFTDVTSSVFPGGVPRTQTGEPSSMAVADFNGDGLPDVYIGDGGPDINGQRGAQSDLLFTTAAGQFLNATSHLPQISSWTENGCAVDLLHNGVIDILTDILTSHNEAPVLDINDGTGQFHADQSRIPYVPNILCIRGVDVNNDGFPDIILGINTGGGLSAGPDLLFLNDGTGHFQQAPLTALPQREFASDGGGTSSILAADLDGDGWQDLVEVQGGTTDLTGAGASERLVLLLNNHDETFRDESVRFPADTTGLPFGFEIPIDLNGDGVVDIFVPRGARSRFLYNLGGHFLDASDILPIGTPAGLVLPFDAFGDGRIDLFILMNNGYAIARNVKNFDPRILMGPCGPDFETICTRHRAIAR